MGSAIGVVLAKVWSKGVAFFLKYWYVFVILAIIVLAFFYWLSLTKKIESLQKENKEQADYIATLDYLISNYENELRNRDTDLRYKDQLLDLTSKMKVREIIREKYFNTVTIENKKIVEEYAKTQNELPVLCAIDRSFGIVTADCQ